jgi:hypothetical protein
MQFPVFSFMTLQLRFIAVSDGSSTFPVEQAPQSEDGREVHYARWSERPREPF